MEFSNSVKFKPTDPKQRADSHCSHLSCHHSYCVWPWGLLRGCNVTIPGKVHGQCVTYCSHCSLYLRLEVPSPGKLLLTYEVGIRSPCLWYHSTLAFYPSPASLLPGNFSITPKCSQELQDGKSGNTWILLLLLYHPAWSHCQIQHCCSLTQLCLTLCTPLTIAHRLPFSSLSFMREAIGAPLVCKMDTWMTGRLVGFFKPVMWYYLYTWWSRL